MINFLYSLCSFIICLAISFELLALTYIWGWSLVLEHIAYPNLDRLPDKLFDKEQFKPWKGILYR